MTTDMLSMIVKSVVSVSQSKKKKRIVLCFFQPSYGKSFLGRHHVHCETTTVESHKHSYHASKAFSPVKYIHDQPLRFRDRSVSPSDSLYQIKPNYFNLTINLLHLQYLKQLHILHVEILSESWAISNCIQIQEK